MRYHHESPSKMINGVDNSTKYNSYCLKRFETIPSVFVGSETLLEFNFENSQVSNCFFSWNLKSVDSWIFNEYIT